MFLLSNVHRQLALVSTGTPSIASNNNNSGGGGNNSGGNNSGNNSGGNSSSSSTALVPIPMIIVLHNNHSNTTSLASPVPLPLNDSDEAATRPHAVSILVYPRDYGGSSSRCHPMQQSHPVITLITMLLLLQFAPLF